MGPRPRSCTRIQSRRRSLRRPSRRRRPCVGVQVGSSTFSSDPPRRHRRGKRLRTRLGSDDASYQRGALQPQAHPVSPARRYRTTSEMGTTSSSSILALAPRYRRMPDRHRARSLKSLWMSDGTVQGARRQSPPNIHRPSPSPEGRARLPSEDREPAASDFDATEHQPLRPADVRWVADRRPGCGASVGIPRFRVGRCYLSFALRHVRAFRTEVGIPASPRRDLRGQGPRSIVTASLSSLPLGRRTR